MKSIFEHGLIAGGKKQKKDEPSSSHHSTFSGKMRRKKQFKATCQFRESLTTAAIGNMIKTLLIEKRISRAQDQGLRFWQTKSHAIIVHNLVPPDCIFKVITKNGERTLFDGLSTARPSPTRRRRLGENREDESQGSVKQEADSSRTEITTSIFNRVDLRIDGIPQEAILNDEIQMKDSNENFQKLQIGSQMQAICDDLNKRIF